MYLGHDVGNRYVRSDRRAKEQLLKLDLLPTLVAVFMIGFGDDQVRNLLKQKSVTDDTSAAPQSKFFGRKVSG